MPDLSPAAELRAAAERLRWLLHADGMPEQVRLVRWRPDPDLMGSVTAVGEDRPVAQAFWGGVGEYMVAMQPAVGIALATWLATEADVLDELQRVSPGYVLDPQLYQPLVIARAVNTPTEETP